MVGTRGNGTYISTAWSLSDKEQKRNSLDSLVEPAFVPGLQKLNGLFEERFHPDLPVPLEWSGCGSGGQQVGDGPLDLGAACRPTTCLGHR